MLSIILYIGATKFMELDHITEMNSTSFYFMLIQISYMLSTRVLKFYVVVRHLKKYKMSVGQGQQNQCM